MNVTVIGAGFVGLSLSVSFSYLGHSVTCIDRDIEKISKLKDGECFTCEYGMDELLAVLPIVFTEDLTDNVNRSDCVFVCVDTPTSSSEGKADITNVMSVAGSLGDRLNPEHDITVVMKSTVPCGTTDIFERVLRDAIRAKRHNDRYVHVAHNPEFMREGNAIQDMLVPDRVVIGSRDDVATRMLCCIYDPILTQRFPMPNVLCFVKEREIPKLLVTDTVTSELVKYASNAFLALKISYANEISVLAKDVGANMKDISDGMGMDKRIAPYFLNHGLGWGGSCFPKDTKALIAMGKEHGCDMDIVCSAINVNERQKERLIDIMKSRLGELRGKKIAVFGITFKAGTDDVRNSPSADIALRLKSLGADVHAHDPRGLDNARRECGDRGIVFDDDAVNIIRDAYAIIIATDWKCYMTLPWGDMRLMMRYPMIVDARSLMARKRECLDGWIYVTL